MLVLIRRFEPMMDWMAFKYSRGNRNHERTDVHQECYLAFIVAVQKFNIEKFRGLSLALWAKIYVKNHLIRFWKTSTGIRIPVHKRTDRFDAQTKAAMGVTQFSQLEARVNRARIRTPPQNMVIDRRFLSPDESAQRNEEIKLVSEAMTCLTGRQTEVLLRISDGDTFAEIGRENGTSRQAVEQFYKKSIVVLENRLLELGFFKSQEKH